MLISIIIPAYNEEGVIKQTLERINYAIGNSKQYGYSWEIIVCDNHSTDKTPEIASSAGARVVKESIRRISDVRNTGAKIAQGEWLIFIDADSYPKPGAVNEVIEIIEKGNSIGCGTTIIVEDGTLFNKLRMERLNPFFRLLKICGGAFIACDHEAYKSIDGFNTHLYAYEDIDFVLRLKKHGRKLGKNFPVLYNHPVITSGRRGDYNIKSLAVLYLSNFAGVILFILQYFLPKKWISKAGKVVSGYWYNNRKPGA